MKWIVKKKRSLFKQQCCYPFYPIQGGCRGGTMICWKEVHLPSPYPHLTTTHTLFGRRWRKNVLSQTTVNSIQFSNHFVNPLKFVFLLLLFRGVRLQITFAAKQRKRSTEHYLWFLRRKNCLFNYDTVSLTNDPLGFVACYLQKKCTDTKHSIQQIKIVYMQR